jgi:4-aminobutyrate aminotransferase-like enzyme/Ser/Thr protein kinase RdoA (MazF antagonist)/biotin carboxyl carrier protein
MTKVPAPLTGLAVSSTSVLDGYIRDSYGLAVESMNFLGGELDRNYRVRTTDNTYLAKLQLRGADRDEQQWQEDILLHLADEDLDVPVPTVVRTTTGATSLSIDSGPEQGRLRLFDWVSGIELAKVAEHSNVLLRQIGSTAARITQALESFTAPDLHSTHHWDVTNSRAAIEVCLADDPSLAEKSFVRIVLAWFDAIAPRLADLPMSMVHHDLNDNNILVTANDTTQKVSGVLDFNDALYTVRVSELAIAGAYAMLRKPDPLAALGHVVAGYNEVTTLSDDEIEMVFPLAAARLCVQMLTWTTRGRTDPTAYGRMRMQYTLPTLLALTRLEPLVASAYLRSVCGRVASPATDGALDLLRNALSVSVFSRSREPVFGDPPANAAPTDPDVSIVASHHLRVHAHRADIWSPGVGEPQTVSLGTAVWTTRPEIVHAPMEGSVYSIDPLVLQHTDASGVAIAYSVWSNLLPLVEVGDRVASGLAIGESLPAAAPGDPTLRVQMVATADLAHRLPAYVCATDAKYWAPVTIDTACWFGSSPDEGGTFDSGLSLVRATGAWVYDERGVRYLDGRSEGGVHVGHADPRIIAAAQRQISSLDAAGSTSGSGRALAQRLLATVPESLDTVLFVDSSDEALRLAAHLANRVTDRSTIARLDAVARFSTEPGAPAAALIVQALISDGVHPLSRQVAERSCERIRSAGGLIIADETDGGPGRSGSRTWRFETLQIVPDIVVVGRAVANGQPIAAILTRSALAKEAGVNPAEYNPNPVAAAVGVTVLDIVERDGLLERANVIGSYLHDGLRRLQQQFAAVLDVRGSGLTAGVELVTGSGSPANRYAHAVCRRLAQRSVLIGRTGHQGNVLTIDPPMNFSLANADLLVDRLAEVLTMEDIRSADNDDTS